MTISCLGALAQVVFIDAPSGKIYIPPPGYPAKEVACRTNATASIKWIQDPGANELDGNVFNIIKKSNTSSVMRLKYEDIIGQVFVILLLPAHEFYCKAGTARSSTFDFAFGGRTFGLYSTLQDSACLLAKYFAGLVQCSQSLRLMAVCY